MPAIYHAVLTATINGSEATCNNWFINNLLHSNGFVILGLDNCEPQISQALAIGNRTRKKNFPLFLLLRHIDYTGSRRSGLVAGHRVACNES